MYRVNKTNTETSVNPKAHKSNSTLLNVIKINAEGFFEFNQLNVFLKRFFSIKILIKAKRVR